MAFQRMTAIHSIPQVVLSDSAPEYIATERSIKEVISLVNSDAVKQRLGDMGVSWRYIPHYSPPKNGLSEIMVK